MTTPKQLLVLQAIERFIRDTACIPTLQQIADVVGLSSLATVHKHLRGLKSLGYVDQVHNRTRSIVITAAGFVYLDRASHGGPASGRINELAEAVRQMREIAKMGRSELAVRIVAIADGVLRG